MPDTDRNAVAILDSLITRLHERGRLRVWSLVVTILGDAVAPRGGRVPLSLLREITERVGVEPGALRTAMSRLAADGWVTRERDGRNSFYGLAEGGRHAFDLATRRIYAAGPPAWNGAWTVAIAAPGAKAAAGANDTAALGFVHVGAGVWLRPETEGAPDATPVLSNMLIIHGQSAEHPETLHLLWPSVELAAAYRGFDEAYAPLCAALVAGGQFSPLDAMATRTLLIHDWRRIVLRDPDLPAALLPDKWPGGRSRKLAAAIYGALLAQSEAWIDEAGLPARTGDAGPRRRFAGLQSPL